MFGDEAFESLKIGSTLLFFSVLLTVVVFSANIGKNMLNKYNEQIITAEDAQNFAAVSKFSGEGQELPVAGAYAFLSYNADHIHTITSYLADGINGITAEDPLDSDIRQHLGGTCRMSASYDRTLGQWDIIICRTKDRNRI